MQYILLHSKSVEPSRVASVVDAISRTAKLLDNSSGAYLFDGDIVVAKEVIDGMIGEFSVSPIKEYKIPDTRKQIGA